MDGTHIEVQQATEWQIDSSDFVEVDEFVNATQAFEIGLVAEKKAYDFYDMALPGITDTEVRALFTELRDEETEHVEMLQEAMAKLPSSASEEIEFDLDETPYL